MRLQEKHQSQTAGHTTSWKSFRFSPAFSSRTKLTDHLHTEFLPVVRWCMVGTTGSTRSFGRSFRHRRRSLFRWLGHRTDLNLVTVSGSMRQGEDVCRRLMRRFYSGQCLVARICPLQVSIRPTRHCSSSAWSAVGFWKSQLWCLRMLCLMEKLAFRRWWRCRFACRRSQAGFKRSMEGFFKLQTIKTRLPTVMKMLHLCVCGSLFRRRIWGTLVDQRYPHFLDQGLLTCVVFS